jgi:uncharacterized protein (TIGR02600 family)
VLLTLLVVAFLIRAQSARNSSVGYRTTTATRLLSDTVVNLVEAEINDATTTARNNTWASQPGAIRAFDNNGNLVSIYRLYSAPSLTATSAAQLANDLPPTTWASSPSVWTDLNAPVNVVGMTDTTGKAVANFQIYPILDNRDPFIPTQSVQIPGFYVNTVNGGSTFPNQSTASQLLKWNQPYMPVQWLYVVKNGSIIAPDQPAAGSSVTFNNVAAANAPSASNPIVGRIAFWTDDESCKLNINTAAGSESMRTDSSGTPSILPAPWETPTFDMWDEYKLFSRNQPVHGEYQRYPGHPATTDLFPVLSGAGGNQSATLAVVSSAYGLGLNFGTGSNSTTFPTQSGVYNPGDNTGDQSSNNPDGIQTPYFSLLPRYNDDRSSKGGIYNTTASAALDAAPSAASITITTKRNRLYTSVGEFLYAQANTTPRTRSTDGNAEQLTRQQIETGKFFLTAHNRAPEVTLFGTPRIPMWPIDSDYTTNGNNSQYLSTFDKVIAFCSSYGAGAPGSKNNYFIQRHDSTTATGDASISRNTKLYSYLLALTSANIPGFGGSFSAKYAAKGEINQILTEMIDYIRSTSTYDWSFVDPNPATGQKYPRFTPPWSATMNGTGQIVPLRIGSTRGEGRIYTIDEIGVHVICTADGNSSLGAYQTPVQKSAVNANAPISPVVGSASDPKYVSNLLQPQFLRLSTGTGSDGQSGTIVDITGATVTTSTPLSNAFPANPTLAASATYQGPANPANIPSVYPNQMTPLAAGQKRLQAEILLEPDCPMFGYNFMEPQMGFLVAGLENLNIGGTNPFTTSSDGTVNFVGSRPNFVGETGGIQAFQYLMTTSNGSGKANGWSTTPVPYASGSYLFVSNPFTVNSAAPLTIGGTGTFTIALQVTPKAGGLPVTEQTFNVIFPSTTAPQPDLMQYGVTSYGSSAGSVPVTSASNPAQWWNFDYRISNSAQGFVYAPGQDALGASQGPGCVIRTDVATLPSTGWTYQNAYGGTTNSVPNVVAPAPSLSGASSTVLAGQIPGTYYKNMTGSAPSSYPPSDVVRTLVPYGGDTRLLAAKTVVMADGTTDMVSHPGNSTDTTVKLIDSFMYSGKPQSLPGVDVSGCLVPNAAYAAEDAPKALNNLTPLNTWDWDSGFALMPDGAYCNKPDEGNVYDSAQDPYYNPGQAGTVTVSYFSPNRIIPSPVMFGSLPTGVMENIPWRTLLFRPGSSADGSTYLHPSRGIPSAGFTANTVPTPPYATPPDELLLDLFDMPVVEPYAISEPFSTAGKVNMNYQIVPFTYITRDTAVRAVLGSEMIPRVPIGSEGLNSANAHSYYRSGPPGSNTLYAPKPTGDANADPHNVTMMRIPLDVTSDYATTTSTKSENNGTLAQFQSVFASGDIFRSPAQICDIYLVPRGLKGTDYGDAHMAPAGYDISNYVWPNFGNLWYGSDFAMVGDNARERPYADIYSRLTTKSNTFTVHYRVQTLANPPAANQAQWSEATGVVTGEYRGSTTLERYLDPNDTTIPDYAGDSSPLTDKSLDSCYQWRTVSNTAFAP